MPQFTMSSPDGKKYTVTAPEGTSQQEAFQTLQRQLDQPQPGYLAGAGRALRGAARGLAGNVGDAMRLSHVPVLGSALGAVFPPVEAWRLASEQPGGPTGAQDRHTAAAERAVQDFGNAPTPSGAEWGGWAASQALPAALGPNLAVGRALAPAGRALMGGVRKGFAEKTGQALPEIPDVVADWLGQHGLSHVVAKHFGAPAWWLTSKTGRKASKGAMQGMGRATSSENPPNEQQ